MTYVRFLEWIIIASTNTFLNPLAIPILCQVTMSLKFSFFFPLNFQDTGKMKLYEAHNENRKT